MKSLIRLHLFLFAVVAALIVSALALSEGTGQTRISSQSFTLLGFSLAKNEIGDVERRLGSARVSPAPEHEMTQRCYESGGPDHTVVVFRDWVGTLSGFKIYKSTTNNPLCTKTALVSSDISTASGLKLGISQRQVLQILGKPQKEVAGQWIYKDESEKLLTPEDVAQFERTHHGESSSDLHIWNFTEIKLLFKKSRVSSIDVTHTETT